MKKIIFILVAMVLIASVASAQLKQGALGIQTGVTGNAATDVSLGGVYNLSNNLRLNARIGFGSVSPTGVASTSKFTIGAGVDYFMNTTESVSPFIGGGLQFTTYTGGSDFGIMAKAGAEYWFSSRFSVSGFFVLGFISSGPSGGTTSIFGTTMGTALTIYLN